MTSAAIQTRNANYFAHRDGGRLSTQQQTIMDRIAASNRQHGPHNFSLREIAAITGLEINAVSGRVNELKGVGLLVEDTPRACRVSGNKITPVKVPEQQPANP